MALAFFNANAQLAFAIFYFFFFLFFFKRFQPTATAPDNISLLSD